MVALMTSALNAGKITEGAHEWLRHEKNFNGRGRGHVEREHTGERHIGSRVDDGEDDGAYKEELKELWKGYFKRRSVQDRNALALRYMGFVNYVAEKMDDAISKNGVVDVDDFRGEGYIGLLGAIEGFDPSRGVKFETYAFKRIRGAILDGLREIDNASRVSRKRVRKVEKAGTKLKKVLGREPMLCEVLREAKVSEKKYRGAARACATTKSLDAVVDFESDSEDTLNSYGNDIFYRGLFEDEREMKPEERASLREVREIAVGSLDRNEREVMLMYFFGYLNMNEIGRMVGLAESRVCEIINNSILPKLWFALGDYAPRPNAPLASKLHTPTPAAV